jgi:hypothetical protein
MVRFAWVGGSIWGVEFGGLGSVIVTIVLLKANWRLELSSRKESKDVTDPSETRSGDAAT